MESLRTVRNQVPSPTSPMLLRTSVCLLSKTCQLLIMSPIRTPFSLCNLRVLITGKKLVNQTITLSTHRMHISSRHTIIEDTKRYEWNNLLFAVGFVLRRNDNPRPFWPVLSNLSSTFRDMEVESEFLTNESSRPRVQIVLEDMLASLNSRQRWCHLPLYDANLLTL